MQQDLTSFANFDFSEFPIVKVGFTGVKITDQLFEEYLSTIEQIWERGQSYGIIFDARKIRVPGFRYIKAQADWLKINENELITYCRGVAYVIDRPIIRIALRFVFFLQAQPVPFKVVSNMEQATEYCKSLTNQLSA